MSIAYLEIMREQSRGQPETARLAVAADVLSAVLENAKEGGSFRYLVYDRLGFSKSSVASLYLAGGAIIADTYTLPGMGLLDGEAPQLVDLRALAEAAPMTPHPTLRTAGDAALMWPTEERTVLFRALNFAEGLLESNKQLLEANRRLAERCEQLETSAAPPESPAQAQAQAQ